jgi:mono/diheme cytochrome c family protein
MQAFELGKLRGSCSQAKVLRREKWRDIMISPVRRTAVLLSALLLSSVTLAMGQETKTEIKKVPITRTSATSGAEMYREYCAVCHGTNAKGDGPAVPALKVPPTDLTTLAKRHDGKFPDTYVVTVLENGLENSKAHGSKDMPTWGPLFGSIGTGQAESTPAGKLRITNLTNYLETLQSK